MANEVELLPCPFCGSAAGINETPGHAYVWCAVKPGDSCGIEPETAIFKTKEDAIAAWNTRAETKAEADNKRLREARLSAPVSEAEWEDFSHYAGYKDHLASQGEINALIASRTQAQKVSE